MHRKGVSYGLNWTGVHGFTYLLSREVVVALSAIRMPKQRHDFIMLLDNIYMGITS
jgi:hypothetical protein